MSVSTLSYLIRNVSLFWVVPHVTTQDLVSELHLYVSSRRKTGMLLVILLLVLLTTALSLYALVTKTTHHAPLLRLLSVALPLSKYTEVLLYQFQKGF